MKKRKWDLKAVSRAIHVFSLSVGITALCMLVSLSFLKDLGEPAALEASVFNSGRSFRAASSGTSAAAAPAGEKTPGAVIPLGTVFGIRLFTDGVIVASLSQLDTEQGLRCPAADAGLKPGDYLLRADGMEIQNNAALARYIGGSAGRPVNFLVKRGDATFEAAVTPAFSGGSFKTGMWIRDSAAGIGTLTFYDPQSGRFAGLGHGICDMDVGSVMSLKTGEPAPVTLCGILRGEPQAPGQLKGYFSSDSSLGSLLGNDETGVYGTLKAPPAGEPVKVLSREEVREGSVQILATVDESGPRLYDGEIRRVGAAKQRTRNLVIKITDQRLLTLTGGIVQGMSGCPILQDGKLAGAVTHVFTEDPTTGYGIFAQTMWEEAAVS